MIIGPDGQVIDLDDLDPRDLPGAAVPALSADDPQIQQAMLKFLERPEQLWCEEQVPALGGVTPRQAAADPTRRDALIRLIASFPTIEPSSGAFGLRPDRLRALLDLPQ